MSRDLMSNHQIRLDLLAIDATRLQSSVAHRGREIPSRDKHPRLLSCLLGKLAPFLPINSELYTNKPTELNRSHLHGAWCRGLRNCLGTVCA